MYIPVDNELFHIHTYRCMHAEQIPDEAYIKRAIELGASRIVFTDHAPFPQDPFGQRMKYAELDKYIKSMRTLKEKYEGLIEVLCGLEVEYLPSYRNYYEYLRDRMDVLILGQHFYEVQVGKYSFELPEEELVSNEFRCASLAIMEGIRTGLFEVVAHPDRSFRRQKNWKNDMRGPAQKIILEAQVNDVALEINYASKKIRIFFGQSSGDCLKQMMH